jgi:hypothetical protein
VLVGVAGKNQASQERKRLQRHKTYIPVAMDCQGCNQELSRIRGRFIGKMKYRSKNAIPRLTKGFASLSLFLFALFGRRT